jgi:FYVE/RhoGEF/PH domain-containing protein 5/6
MNQQGRRIPPNPAAIIKVQSFIRRRLAGLTLEKLALHQRQRTRVCYEILETEKSYVKYLEQLGKFYLQPLIDAGHVKKQEHLKLFNMVDDVRKINLFILAELEKRMGNWERLLTRDQRIGDIFAKLSPFLKIYSDYVSEYQSNLSEVNRLFDKKSSFLKKCMDKVPTDYDQLQTAQFLLIMPVQRIPRYQLLVAELLKHTQYEHSDYAELTKALDAIKAAGSKVEEVVKERQSIEKIVEINKKVIRPSKRDLPDSFVDLGRSYVYEGSLMKVSHKSNQERYIFLFSDSILYTKQISSSEYEGRFFTTLTGTSITDLPDTGTFSNPSLRIRYTSFC